MADVKQFSAAAYSSNSSGGSTAKREKKSTFDKWQCEHEREHQTLIWLLCTLEGDRVHMAA